MLKYEKIIKPNNKKKLKYNQLKLIQNINKYHNVI